ncbi:MAG: NCS2 family permease [Deltaproteobacteria bacterium]|nr:NCS2 family permease [Deltaproteobacteria bacterium]
MDVEPTPLRENALERRFGVAAAGSTIGREVVGGLTTFLSMAYIVVVNPVFLAAAGIPREDAVLATIAASAFATALMGLGANLPVALAPGMGMNAFFTYTICLQHQVPWRTALGLLVLVSLAFLALTVGRVRRMITEAVPKTLRFAAAVGIGLFISLIGFQQAGIVVAHPATLVALGDPRAAPTLLALGGLAATLALMARGVRTAVFWGMVSTAAAGWLAGILAIRSPWLELPHGRFPGLEMDLGGALRLDLVPLAVVLLFFAIFDAMGTLFAVGAEAGLLDEQGRFPRLGRALTVDALGALAGAGMGTSSVTCYIESATGTAVGARTGLANLVTAGCFLVALFLAPLVAQMAAGVTVGEHSYYPVTSPALIVVGVLMARSVVRIDWGDLTEAVPAFLTLAVMPATFSISHGLAAGFVSYAGMKLAAGRAGEAHWLIYAIAIVFVGRYLWLG